MIYKTIEEFLEQDKRTNVILTIANYAIVAMTENLIQSANKVGIPFVLFALDEKIAKTFENICTVVMYDLKVESERFYVFKEDDYWDLTFARWAIWGDILAGGKTFIQLDADMVILKNFEADVLKQLETRDCVIQHIGAPGNPKGCPGVLAVKPGITSSVFTFKFLVDNGYKRYVDDQTFFNEVVRKRVNYGLLSLNDYPHFDHYRHKKGRLRNKCYLVHFNYIIGHKEKIDEMKNYGLWDIGEIARTKLINDLIKEHNYQSYLEIGIGNGVNFAYVICKHKISIDPKRKAIFKMTSDEFFEQNKEQFDIVFVDGLHLADQVIKDVHNALTCLNENGCIVIHDCLPLEERLQTRERPPEEGWQGDVWKAIVQFAREGLSMKLHKIETGIIVLTKEKKGVATTTYIIPHGELNWEWYLQHYENMLK